MLDPKQAETLWAVHITGPDDIVPVAGYLDAVHVANAFNAWWQAQKTSKPLHEYDPRMWAAPVEWDGDPERHAEWVVNPSPDYAAFIPPPLSTVTPAEVGGLVDAQTEARAIAQTSLWIPAKPKHAELGWSYDFEQTERIARAAYDSTGYDATMEVVEFVMAEADRRYAAALAAKDEKIQALNDECQQSMLDIARERDRAERAEAQLAEARKALEPFAWIGQWLFARDLPDETPVVMVEGAGKPFALTRGMFKAAHTAARRALTGGKNG